MNFLAAPIIIIGLVVLYILNSIKVLREYERGVIFRLGRVLPKPKGPGIILVFSPIDRMVRVSLRLVAQDIPPQDVITRDNVSVKVNAVLYFRVVEPLKCIIDVQDYLYATSQIAQTTLRSVLGQVDLFHLDKLDLDAPGVSVLFDDLLEAGVELVPLREKVVERHLAEETPQSRLGQLGRGVDIILDLDHALERVDDPEVQDGVDLDRDVVLGDDVLRRDVHRDEPQADPDHAVDWGEHQDDPRALGLGKHSAQPENHAPLVFPKDLDGAQDVEDHKSDDDDRRR